MFHLPFHFVRDAQELKTRLFPSSSQRCPHCGCVGTLNRHSRSSGNDPANSQRPGCPGPAGVLFQSRAARRLRAAPFRSSWPRFCRGTRSRPRWCGSGWCNCWPGFRSRRRPRSCGCPLRWKRSIGCGANCAGGWTSVRTRLCREQPPPASTQSDPLLQTVEHLQAVFPRSACPPAEFQLHFQHPFLG